MQATQIAAYIQELPLFERLQPAELNLVAQAFQPLTFQAGEWVIKQGNPTQGMFILVSGHGIFYRVSRDGTPRPIDEMHPYDELNDDALFTDDKEPVSLQVTQPSLLLFLSRKRMDKILAYYPHLRPHFLSILAQTAVPSAPTPAPVVAPSVPAAPVSAPPSAVSVPPIAKPKPVAAKHGEGYLQHPDEHVIITRRRHPWFFIRRGWVSVLVFVVFVALSLMAFPFSMVAGWSVVGLGGVIASLLMLYFFLEWRNDSMIVTDYRVIRIERVIPTFSVSISEIPLQSVQEVSTALPQGDLFARIFNYGDIELKNASGSGDLVLDTVPNPQEVQNAIFTHREQRQQREEQNRRQTIRAELEAQLGLNDPAEPEAATSAPQPRQDAVRSFSPAAMRFTNKDGDTVIRKHVTVWLQAVIAPSLMIIGAFVIMGVSLGSSDTWLSWVGVPLALAFLLIGGLWFWWSDWDWRNDMYILTDDTITLIHKRPLWLQNEVEQVLLSRVDNVVSETSGLIDTLFQRGNVRISLVGEGLDRGKVFLKVHRPHDIQAEISRRQARAKSSAATQNNDQNRQAIAEYLAVYHESLKNRPPTAPNPNRPQPYQTPDQQRPPNTPRR